MLSKHRVLRLTACTTVCALLSLATVATGSAYPITPDGEPLHVEAGATPTTPAAAVATSVVGRSDPASIPANVVPVEEVSPEDNAWLDTSLMAMAALAVLVLAIAALRVAGSHSGTATRDPGRERS